MDKFKLRIVSPDRLYYEGEADMLEFETTEGRMGIYKNHVPTTVILVPCVIKIHNGDEVKKCMSSGGFIEILQDKVTIMAEDVLDREEVDIMRAEESRKRATERINSKSEEWDMDRAEVALKRAIARLELTDR